MAEAWVEWGVFEWVRDHPWVTGWMLAGSAVVFLAGLVTMPVLLVKMRADYFVRPDPPVESWAAQHGAWAMTVLILKNALGAVLVLLGIAMLVLPGQGILTILLGLSLVNFPGKRKLELAIVRQRPIRRGINRIRGRRGRPPLILPPR